MALTRLQNIISSVEGRILYVNPDDFDATDAIDNKGNSPIRPFKTIARAVLEVARYSYVSAGNADDKFDQFTILLYPGDHIVDNRPGSYALKLDGSNNIVPNVDTAFTELASEGNLGWSNSTKEYADLFRITNATRGGLIIPRGVSIIGLDLRKTKLRPKYVPGGGNNTAATSVEVNFDVNTTNRTEITINSVSGGEATQCTFNDIYVGAEFKTGIQDANGNNLIEPGTTITSFETALGGQTFSVNISKPHTYSANTSGIQGTLQVPFEDDNTRTALFRITGGCYFWQFSIFDGDTNGVYDSSPVLPVAHTTAWPATVSPFFSHTKLTIFEYASLHDLHVFYRKVSDAITLINSEKIEPKIQENRIVGPLADSVQITKVRRNATTVTVTLAEELNLTAGNFVSIKGNGNFITNSANTNGFYSGEKRVSSVISRSEFTFVLTPTEVSQLDTYEAGSDDDVVLGGTQITYESTIGASAKVEIEIDTVESASPYIFNISLRSTYGTCGMHADGSRATGFKSMVVAQYTGISLQKEDSAFYVYDGNAGQYVSAGQGGHTNINSIYKPEARSFHVKASNRAVIQAVSVFAVGFADHFIAEDGGDMSITNSNSNFGSNSMRSIGFSDKAFNKDALGEITHIIPPRNIEAAPTNVYWESLDVVKTQTNTQNPNTRLYIDGRTTELAITAPGTGFTGGNYEAFLNGVGTGKNLTITVSNGEVDTATFQSQDYGSLQPGDKVTLASPANGGLPAEITIGGSLTSLAGEFKIGYKNLDKTGAVTQELLYVPLFATAGAQEQTVQTAVVQKDGTTNNVFEYDYTLNNWYIRVSSSNNDIYSILSTNTTRYGSSLISVTPTSYIERLVDERVDDDKIFRLRYVTRRGEDGTLPSFPQSGYVIQPKKGEVRGIGDRFTDAANLLLLNKETMAQDVVSRYKTYVGGGNLPNTDADATTSCEQDIVRIIETIAYDLRYGGNARTYDGAAYYAVGGAAAGATGIEGERDETVAIINSVSTLNGGTDLFDGLRMMFNNVINNGVIGAPVNAKVWGNSPGNLLPEYITGEEQLTNTPGGCANVISAADTLLNIYTTALGSDATPGTLGSVTRVTHDSQRPRVQVGAEFFNVYDRISGHEYNDVYYIYEVEEEQEFSYDAVNNVETPGIYYLTVLKGSVYINGSPTASDAALANNTFRFSQEIEDLYPQIDIDNVVSDPIIAKSVADPVIIGQVKTQDGTNSNVNLPTNKSFSITKEALGYFLDEYLTNEIEWDWDGIGDNTIVHRDVANPIDGSNNDVILTNLAAKSGSAEVRKIDLNPGEPGWTLQVELRRPSTIRSGNHTFEYVGFGPGNYSTAFPIRQTKVLSAEEQKYSQSLKEAGGIAFYSGLNSNGDLYIGNTVINAVTGKTTSNEINELTSLTIKNNLNVLGGTGNTIATNFQGPVNLIGNLNADGGNYLFSNVQLRNSAGFTTKFTNNSTANLPGSALKSDVQFNLDPTDGGFLGHVYTDDNEWRPFGLIGTEKVHIYKSLPMVGSNSGYTVNIGNDYDGGNVVTQTAYNFKFDLDVTGRQRISKSLVIGNAQNDNNFTDYIDNINNKGSFLINPDWTAETNVNKYGMIIKLQNQGNGKYVDFRTATNSSVFTVDQGGNVEIPVTAKYGLAERAWSVTLTVVAPGTNTSGTNNISFTNLAGNFFANVDVDRFTGTSANGTINPGGFVWASEVTLDGKTFYGAPGQLTQYKGNSNAVMIFVNGVMQDPYIDSHFASDGKLYFTGQPQVNDVITVRGFAT